MLTFQRGFGGNRLAPWGEGGADFAFCAVGASSRFVWGYSGLIRGVGLVLSGFVGKVLLVGSATVTLGHRECRRQEPLASASLVVDCEPSMQGESMRTIGNERAGVRVTKGRLDRRGKWHPWQPCVFLLWKGGRVG